MCPCGNEFIATVYNHVYCGESDCDFMAARKPEFDGLPSSAVGSIYELGAATFLMGQGWLVFRNLSPCGEADIVALRKDEMLLIDVKSQVSDSMVERWPIEKPHISLLEVKRGVYTWKYKSLIPLPMPSETMSV